MLVLTRKANQGITIDHPLGPIHLIVVEIKNRQYVRIGIQADRRITVHRDEVLAQITQEGDGG